MHTQRRLGGKDDPNYLRRSARHGYELFEGAVPQSRIDDAVLRILRVKCAMGLTSSGPSPLANRSLHKNFGCAENRAVARECVRQSMLLLKNTRGALPLSKSAERFMSPDLD